MPYADAPSGYVTIDHYKEPFMPFKDGFGFEGALLFDRDSDKTQCHLCGEWLDYLPNHLKFVHKTVAAAYRATVGLGPRTGLVSGTYKKKLLAKGTERFKNLRPGKRRTPEEKAKISSGLKRFGATREKQNLHGTCPEQLKAYLRGKAKELGRTPTTDEIENRIKTITKVFGSASNAMVEAGLTPRPNGRNLATREHVQNDLVEYVFTYGKLPTEKAFSDEMNSVIISEFGSLKEALVAAGFTKVI